MNQVKDMLNSFFRHAQFIFSRILKQLDTFKIFFGT